MKKLIALVLAVMMLASCAASAEDVRMRFESDEAQQVTGMWVDETGSMAIIISRLDRNELVFDHPHACPGTPSSTEFDILVMNYHADDILPVLRLWVNYHADEALNISAVSFDVDGKVFRFDEVSQPGTTTVRDGVYMESPMIVLGVGQLEFILALEMYVERLNESDGVLSGFVTMTLHGDTDVTVTLDASFLVDYLSVMRVLNSATALVYMQYVEGTPMTIIE